MNRPRILHVVHRFPYPPDKGDRIRVFHMLKHLSTTAEVWLVAMADEPVSNEQAEFVRQMVHRLEIVPQGRRSRLAGAGSALLQRRSLSEGVFRSRKVRHTIQSWCKEAAFDAALFSASSLGAYAELPELRNTRKVVDFMDVDSAKWKQYADSALPPRAWLYRREHRYVRHLEQHVLKNVDAVVFVSEDEANLFHAVCTREKTPTGLLKRVHAVGNGVDCDYFMPAESHTRPSICFLGAMDYQPNIDAVVWFAHEVWPRLRKTYPELIFNIVGRNPARLVRNLDSRGEIHITGRVDDVRPWVAQATTVIAPLRIARGVQNKVLEALAMGRAVVASPEALVGLQTTPEVNVLQATTPDDWFHQIRRIIDEPELAYRLGLDGRAYVEHHHSWSARLQTLTPLLGMETSREGMPVLH